MNPLFAYFVFFSAFLPSIILSVGNYITTKERIIDDVNQALAKTIQESIGEQITADTLRVFRANLQTEQIKATSYLALCTNEPSKSSLSSDTMSFCSGNKNFLVRAYPNCSRAAIFGMSEQKWPSLLFLFSILWGTSAFFYLRRNKPELGSMQGSQIIELGGLSFSISGNCFYNEKQERLGFTPMQFQLMKLLITSDGHRCSVDELCRELWPGKEDARDTLYTLIRRLKPIVESDTKLRIHSEKGSFYALRQIGD